MTATTTTHVTSAVCQVFPNGTYTGSCSSIIKQFTSGVPPWFAPLLYGLIAATVALVGFIGYTKWHQQAWGRRLEGRKKIAFGRYSTGGGVPGWLERLGERFYLMHIGGKKVPPVLISAFPDSEIRMDAEYGNISITVVDMDSRSTVPPDMALWSNTALSELAETHDWPSFCFQYKLKQLSSIELPARKFPKINGDKEQVVELIVIENGKEKTTNKKVSELKPEERAWYDRQAAGEEKAHFDLKASKAIVQAALVHAPEYIVDGKPFSLDDRTRSVLLENIEIELASVRGKVADAVIGGRTIQLKDIAKMFIGGPVPSFVAKFKADIERLAASKGKITLADIMPIIIVVAVCATIMVVAVKALGS